MSMCMFSINLVVLMLQRSKTKRYNIIQNVCVINQITRVYFLNLRPAVVDGNVGDSCIADNFRVKYEKYYNEFNDYNKNVSLLEDINKIIADKCNNRNCDDIYCISSSLMLK